MAAGASKLAKDAVNAAVSAACAAERASITDGGKATDSTSVGKVVKDVRAAAEEAVERARDAIRAEDEHDVVGAVYAANLSARAAQRAGSLASAASVISGKAREMAAGREPQEPAITATRQRGESPQERMRRELADAVWQSAHYLVTYDARIFATFERKRDAFLLEGELADMDRKRDVRSGKCEVLDRVTGHRLGGYLIAGKMLVFLRDESYEARYGKQRRQ